MSFLEGVSRRCPENPDVLKPLADLYTRVGRFDQGLRVDLELARLCPEDCIVWYNLGCSFALTGRKDRAFDALGRAVSLGYDDHESMRRDADLASLHEDPRFDELLRQARN
jgi:hypothetical protein